MTNEPVQDNSEFETIEKLLGSVRPAAVGDVERTFYQAGWAAAVSSQASRGAASYRSGFRWPTFSVGVAAGVAVALLMLNIGAGWKSFRPGDDPFGPAMMAQGTVPDVSQNLQSNVDDAPVSSVILDSHSIKDGSHSADVVRSSESVPVGVEALFRQKPWIPGIPDWLWNREDVTKPIAQHQLAGNSILVVRSSFSDMFTLNEWLEFPHRPRRTGLAQPANNRSPREDTPVLNARPLNLEMLQEWL